MKYQNKEFKELLKENLESVNEESSFDEMIENEGASKDVQIQYLDDNFAEVKSLDDIDFWIDDQGRTFGAFLTHFEYEGKIHLLVYQD